MEKPSKRTQITTSVIINGDTWRFTILSTPVYTRKHSDIADSAAISMVEQRIVDFSQDDFSESVLLHELIHVYFSYLCLDDTTSIGIGDAEEIFANFFVKYHNKILKTYHILYKILVEDVKEL